MKAAHKLFGFLSSFAIIFILLVTAFDVACYSDFGFFEKEYEKYGVLDNLNMAALFFRILARLQKLKIFVQ